MAAGGGGAAGSESWALATVALSSLESARSEAMVALADLDQLHAAEAVAAAETGNQADARAIAAARDTVIALVAEEDRIIAALRGRVRD